MARLSRLDRAPSAPVPAGRQLLLRGWRRNADRVPAMVSRRGSCLLRRHRVAPGRWIGSSGQRGGSDLQLGMTDDNDVRGHINSLIEVERNLRRQMDDGKITTQQERERLRRVQKQLDGYWSLLRERDGEPVS